MNLQKSKKKLTKTKLLKKNNIIICKNSIIPSKSCTKQR
jgi:hypothetical protein